MHFGQRTLGNVLAGEQLVDRKRRVVTVRHGPDDVLGTERGVAAEEYLWIGRAHGPGVDLGHVPLVELDATVALDPRKCVLLANRNQDVVAGHGFVRFARGHQRALSLGIVLGLHLLEGDAGELAIVVGEGRRHHEIEDRNVFVKGVFLLPGRRLHLLEAGTDDHLDVFAAQTTCGAAAVHRGIAAAEHDHAPADLLDMTERHAGKPVDADVDMGGGFLAAGNVELAAARCAGADEDRVVILAEQRLQAVDALAAFELDAEIEDVVGFLVDHRIRQPEFRNLRAHHAARLGVGIEHGAEITERREVPGHRERGRTAADDRNAPAVVRRTARHAVLDVVLEVGGDALQPADRNRCLLDAATVARGLARTFAGAAENSRKHVRSPIDHVGVAIAALGDQADVFGNGCVCGTGPLAIDYFMKVVGCRDIGRFHSYLVRDKFEYRAALLSANAQVASLWFLNCFIGLSY